jgi:hypothetical protein
MQKYLYSISQKNIIFICDILLHSPLQKKTSCKLFKPPVEMGLTIHYSGKLRSPEAIQPLMAETIDICQSLNWPFEILPTDPEIPVEGILVNPEGSEPLWLTFQPDGTMCNPILYAYVLKEEGKGIPEEAEQWLFTKTQYAGVDVHMDRAIRYIEKEGLNYEDELWFVMDVDNWGVDQLREIATYCKQYPNWHIALSNPCFEIWLYFHKKADISKSKSITSKDFKFEISTLDNGGYHPLKYLPSLPDAVENARIADSDKKHFLPKPKETKLYQLGDAVLAIVGKKGFETFVNNILPELLIQEKDRARSSKKIRTR